jgi:hypothetical protein
MVEQKMKWQRWKELRFDDAMLLGKLASSGYDGEEYSDKLVNLLSTGRWERLQRPPVPRCGCFMILAGCGSSILKRTKSKESISLRHGKWFSATQRDDTPVVFCV